MTSRSPIARRLPRSSCRAIGEFRRHAALGRLLALNHERYAEEVRQGLHEKGAKRDDKTHRSGEANHAVLSFEAGRREMHDK